jgi:malic enzyme
MSEEKRSAALEYHAEGRPGKIQVVPTKPTATQRDLSLAYSPGVAEPCLEIEKDPQLAYDYTSKGNLVAVISNGTAVLGLGDIGALAGKPVMEGKGLLFKIFADIDVFDIEVDEKDIDKFIATVKAISPTFGGINLEDVKAPECFEIERRLKEELNIPLMHDDQHGTAIITGAGLLNALEIVGKKIEDVKIVVSGAGASANSFNGIGGLDGFARLIRVMESLYLLISSFFSIISFLLLFAFSELSIAQPSLVPLMSTHAPFSLPFMLSNSRFVLGSATTCPLCTPFVPDV